MSRSRARTVTFQWRRIGAALPAVALIGSGVGLTAFGELSAHHTHTRPVTATRQGAVDVPANPVTEPATPVAPGQPVAPALELPTGAQPGSNQPVTLDAPGIPAEALAAYHRAADLLAGADPACHIDWALPAAIGRVESDHGRFGGNSLDSSGIARPGIYGIALDGSNGTARVPDTDRGVLDGDPVWDRAVGPMQFIPGTWRVVGSDADGDGVKNPQDMFDAATATAVYLCAGPGDLSQPADLYAAILRYNHSDAYVRTVIAIADAYRRGVTVLPASALPAAAPARAGASAANAARASQAAKAAAAKPASGSSGSAQQGGQPVPATSPTSSSQPTGPTTILGQLTQPLTAPSSSSSSSSSVVNATTPTPLTSVVCVLNTLGVKVCSTKTL